MGRGASRKLYWDKCVYSLDAVLDELVLDEIWLQDLTCRVIDRYCKESGHAVIFKNQYPTKRFQMVVSTNMLLSRGWKCKRRNKYSFLKVNGVKERVKTRKIKAFKIGENE